MRRNRVDIDQVATTYTQTHIHPVFRSSLYFKTSSFSRVAAQPPRTECATREALAPTISWAAQNIYRYPFHAHLDNSASEFGGWGRSCVFVCVCYAYICVRVCLSHHRRECRRICPSGLVRSMRNARPRNTRSCRRMVARTILINCI